MDPSASGIGALIVTTTTRVRFAQVAATSLRQHHPNMAVNVMVVDDRFREVSLRFRTQDVSWRSAGEVVGVDVVADLMAEYPSAEAAVVCTPRLLLWALENTGSTNVLLLSDRLDVQTSLDSFFAQVLGSPSGDHSIGLVQVRNGYPPVDGRLPDATDLISYGQNQRGIALFGAKSGPMIEWWRDQLLTHPLESSARFNRLAHPWFDEFRNIAPAEVVIADYGLVGSFRNFDLSELATSPAAIVDFDGFDPSRPWALSDNGGNWPRVLLSDYPLMASIVQKYTDDLQTINITCNESPFERLANGHQYDRAMRRVYVDALVAARRESLTPPANPFVDPTGFVELLAQEVPDRPTISRHLAAWKVERPDLARAFDDDDLAFWKWAETDALAAGIWIPARRQTAPSPADDERSALPDTELAGVNVVGLLSAQLGVGEHGRLALRSVRDSSIPFSIIDHDDTIHHRDATVLDGWPMHGFRFDIDMLLVNADQTRSALQRFQRPGHPSRPTIGLWAWEVPVFPERHHEAYQYVSEVWVLSEFVRASLIESASAHNVNVEVFPLSLPYVRDRHPAGHYADLLAPLGVDTQRPFVSFMFDYFSVAERKQPWRAIEAFVAAFPVPTRHGPQLVIKSMNHKYFPVEREHTHHAARGRSDIVFIEQYLDVPQRDALVSAATAYMSLHRSEGFGLTLAEAMGAGTPCIATAWSGNLDFMTTENSFLVDVDLVDIPLSVPAYAGMGQWAEPSVEHASLLLQQLLAEPDLAAARAAQAVQDLQARNQSGADAQFVVERVRHLRHQHSQSNMHSAPRAIQGALR
jgi:glycosyltransferase involved in cell wall biosynthesis